MNGIAASALLVLAAGDGPSRTAPIDLRQQDAAIWEASLAVTG